MANGTTAYSQTTIGKYLLDSLYNHGVKHIFGIPGDYILNFDKLIEEHPIKYINATRENTAGYMADAYARLNGLGVACITYGVGINIANALSQAYAESSPLVIISGTAGMNEFAKGRKLHHLLNKHSILHQMDTTQLEIFTHFTIDQAVLTSPEEAKNQIDRVLWNCLKHKKPVYIELPRDLVHSQITQSSFEKASEQPQSTPKSREALLQPLLVQIESLLKKSKNPIIWAGHEILRYKLSKELLRFAERHNIPIVSTLLGKTAVDEHHPLFLGIYQGRISHPEIYSQVEKADCILILGTLLSDVDTGLFTARLDNSHKITANADEVFIDGQHFFDINFAEFIEALGESNFQLPNYNHVRKIKSKESFIPRVDTPITTARLFACISSLLHDEHIVASDFGDSLFGSIDFQLRENSFISCAYFGSLGFGVPAALGAHLAAPDRRIIGIVGDGAFQMTCTELSTAARYQLDPIVIVLNNHGYGTERPLLEGQYNDIHNWNYSLMPQFLNGGIGIKVTTEQAFEAIFKEALTSRGQFYLIEVELGKTDFSPALQRFLSFAQKK